MQLPSQTPGFFTLPRELRDSIYEYIWGDGGIVSVAGQYFIMAHPPQVKFARASEGLPMWLLANKQFLHEGLQVFGRTNVFGAATSRVKRTIDDERHSRIGGVGFLESMMETKHLLLLGACRTARLGGTIPSGIVDEDEELQEIPPGPVRHTYLQMDSYDAALLTCLSWLRIPVKQLQMRWMYQCQGLADERTVLDFPLELWLWEGRLESVRVSIWGCGGKGKGEDEVKKLIERTARRLIRGVGEEEKGAVKARWEKEEQGILKGERWSVVVERILE